MIQGLARSDCLSVGRPPVDPPLIITDPRRHMAEITLAEARTIISRTLEKGRELKLNPLSVCVLDAGGHLRAFEREDGASNLRFQIAFGKANGALGLGVGTRALMKRAEQQAYFILAANGAFDGGLVPVPGGVLVRDPEGKIVGAVGVTGDSSDNDEIAAVAGIEAAGYSADGG
jgi:uncharacterized protein GlcG (DUF336 family)